MWGWSTKQRSHQARPKLEGLESRTLLSTQYTPKGVPIADKDLARYFVQSKAPVPVNDRRLEYTTADGAHVVISLYGAGSLSHSFDPDGALNLRFQGTNQQSGIVGMVHGGNGLAPLRSLSSANAQPGTLSGIGGTALNVVNLKNFDLVDGGRVNLTSGVHTFFLNSVGQNTQVNLRELPSQVLNANTSTGTTTSVTENGLTLGYLTGSNGSLTLQSVSGVFTPGTNLPQGATTPLHPNLHPAPPGIIASINDVNGPPRADSTLGDPNIFGYDATANALIRFDVTSGNPDLTIPNALPVATPDAGVALARDNGQLVVLISDGQNVYAYNPLDGSKVGQFSVANLATSDPGTSLNHPTRLGTVDAFTVIGDPTAGDVVPPATEGNGLLLILNVTASLATGQAVPVGVPFAAQRQFGLSGGQTGLPGFNTLYAAGGGHFDTFQPDAFQLGLAALSPSSSGLRETSRFALTSRAGTTISSDAHGATAAGPSDALGSDDELLALVRRVTNGTNLVNLYNPSGSSAGTLTLNDPNRLTGLSATFRPSLAGTALVDIQGNVQSFRAHLAQGLVLNDLGNLNLAKIDSAADTTIVGYPFGHAAIPRRSNVTIISSTRTVDDRNGVTVMPGISPTGPLTLP
jgi:hypothetical protein